MYVRLNGCWDVVGPLSWLETSTDKVTLYGILSHYIWGRPIKGMQYQHDAFTKLKPFVNWVNLETDNCNSKTCREGCVF